MLPICGITASQLLPAVGKVFTYCVWCYFAPLFTTFLETGKMASLKIVLAFTNLDQGWTETYYVNNPVPGNLQSQFNAYAVPLVNLRLPLLSNNCKLTFVRISLVGIPFAVQTFELQDPGTYIANAAVPNVAILLRFYPTVAGPAKALYLHGFPATCLDNGAYRSTFQFATALQALSNFLTAGSQGATWGWIGVNQSTKRKAPMLGYLAGLGFQIVLTFSPLVDGTEIFAGLPFGLRTRVRLSGVNGKSELNGVQTVLISGANTCQTAFQFGVLPYTHGGFGVYEPTTFINVGNVIAEKAVTRKTGRPLFLARGRVPARSKT
jgi:hypothetical protein